MKKSMGPLLLVIMLAAVFSGCPAKPEPPAKPAEQKPLVVFLVRHAEKVDASKDPELSEDGKARADELARALASANIEHIHSTDFIRTKNTAAPVSAETGLKTETYDPKDLAGFAKKLKETGGRHLVVGHSNTTPELTKLLGGDAGAEIDEKSEYDRLYIVTIGRDGTANSVMMRYGKAFEKKEEKSEAKAAGG